ncbi:MAG: hypothetical protein RLZ12_423 [Bacillota bacterium]|jgi:uncharacterized cofD-like protein
MNYLQKRPNIVCIGGGTGLPTILSGLVGHAELTAIVTVTDDGGSSGYLRQAFNMPPPGDIRNALVAMAQPNSPLSALCQYRFPQTSFFSGHPLGNLMLTGLMQMTNDFAQAVENLSQLMGIRGQVLPASTELIHLKAELTDGSTVHGECHIRQARKKIKQLTLIPDEPIPLPQALSTIHAADLIVIGPGSLYTSILPNLLIPKIKTALQKTSAPKLFICNIMTEPGETDNFTASDHITTLHKYLSEDFFNYVLVNTGTPDQVMLKRYTNKKQHLVTPNTILNKKEQPYQILTDNLYSSSNFLRHDPAKVCQHVLTILKHRQAGQHYCRLPPLLKKNLPN